MHPRTSAALIGAPPARGEGPPAPCRPLRGLPARAAAGSRRAGRLGGGGPIGLPGNIGHLTGMERIEEVAHPFELEFRIARLDHEEKRSRDACSNRLTLN